MMDQASFPAVSLAALQFLHNDRQILMHGEFAD